MRTTRLFGTLVLAGAFSLVAAAAEKPPADYVKAMKDLAAVVQAVDKSIEAQDFDAVQKHSASAAGAFIVVANYWRGKAQDAVGLAQAGSKASADMSVSANQKSAEGAAYSAKEIKGVCAGCHKEHREQQPDKSFLIK